MSHKHFTRDDRVKLAVLLKTAITKQEIGRILGKNPTSIRREIKGNSHRGKYLPGKARMKSKERKTHREKRGQKKKEKEKGVSHLFYASG